MGVNKCFFMAYDNFTSGIYFYDSNQYSVFLQLVTLAHFERVGRGTQ